jgi:S1-C subfamily serine protease
MRFITCLVATILFFSQFTAFGQTPTPQEQCVRVIVADKGNMISKGSGAFIRDRIIVTSNHVVADRKQDTVQVYFPGQGLFLGTVIGTDSVMDLAFIKLLDTPRCEPFTVQVNLTPDLTVQGYGEGVYRQRWGTLSNTRTFKGWRKVVNAQARSGDSGGPVLDGCGDYVGTLWGSVDGETYFTPAQKVLEVLERFHVCQASLDDTTDQIAARYHSRGNVEQFFKRGTTDQLAARYHSRKRVKRFFKRVTRKAVA